MFEVTDDMLGLIEEFEETIRLAGFAGTFIVMGILEALAPRKKRVSTRLRRWWTNLGIVFLGTFTVRWMSGMLQILLPVAAAGYAQSKGWGILNQLELSAGWSIIVTILLFDVIIYFQHLLFHTVPLLWRMHKVHHADLDLDVTSGNRFHPVEIVISIFIKIWAVMLIGPLPAAVIVFEVLLNALAQFNHSSVKIPLPIDAVMRWVLVTPDFHRVHHSVHWRETNSNYGFNLTWWDRIFGTYTPQPKDGHEDMKIGLSSYRDEKELNLHQLLVLPVSNKSQGYASSGMEKSL